MLKQVTIALALVACLLVPAFSQDADVQSNMDHVISLMETFADPSTTTKTTPGRGCTERTSCEECHDVGFCNWSHDSKSCSSRPDGTFNWPRVSCQPPPANVSIDAKTDLSRILDFGQNVAESQIDGSDSEKVYAVATESIPKPYKPIPNSNDVIPQYKGEQYFGILNHYPTIQPELRDPPVDPATLNQWIPPASPAAASTISIVNTPDHGPIAIVHPGFNQPTASGDDLPGTESPNAKLPGAKVVEEDPHHHARYHHSYPYYQSPAPVDVGVVTTPVSAHAVLVVSSPPGTSATASKVENPADFVAPAYDKPEYLATELKPATYTTVLPTTQSPSSPAIQYYEPGTHSAPSRFNGVDTQRALEKAKAIAGESDLETPVDYKLSTNSVDNLETARQELGRVKYQQLRLVAEIRSKLQQISLKRKYIRSMWQQSQELNDVSRALLTSTFQDLQELKNLISTLKSLEQTLQVAQPRPVSAGFGSSLIEKNDISAVESSYQSLEQQFEKLLSEIGMSVSDVESMKN